MRHNGITCWQRSARVSSVPRVLSALSSPVKMPLTLPAQHTRVLHQATSTSSHYICAHSHPVKHRSTRHLSPHWLLYANPTGSNPFPRHGARVGGSRQQRGCDDVQTERQAQKAAPIFAVFSSDRYARLTRTAQHHNLLLGLPFCSTFTTPSSTSLFRPMIRWFSGCDSDSLCSSCTASRAGHSSSSHLLRDRRQRTWHLTRPIWHQVAT